MAAAAAPSDPLVARILDVAHGKKPEDAVSAVAGTTGFRSRARELKERLLERLANDGCCAAPTPGSWAVVAVLASIAAVAGGSS